MDGQWKSALVLEIVRGRKTTVADASRAFDLPPCEIEGEVEDDKRGRLGGEGAQ